MLIRYSSRIACFVLGICALHLMPSLPAAGWMWACAASGIFALILTSRYMARPEWLIGAVIAALGFAYAGLRADWRLSSRLDPTVEGRVVVTEGYIAGLPHAGPHGWQFDFKPTRVLSDKAALPPQISVQWYGAHDDLLPGSRWQLALRVKRPHGQQNPGGFDMEAWLMQQGVGATATVKTGTALAGFAWQGAIDRVRSRIAARINATLSESPYAGVLVAEAIGDKHGIDKALFDRFSASGTAHLLVISGLHITLMASISGTVAVGLASRISLVYRRVSLPRLRLYAGWLAAVAYGLLAGFGIPAQRAVLMLTVAMLCLLHGRPVANGLVWLLALTTVLVWDPFAVGSGGFWLSFIAVGSLLWLGSNRMAALRGWRYWGRTELAATLGTLPVILCLFGQMPLVSPLANMVAVPIVSMLVVPLTLLGLIDPTGYALHGAERLFALTDWLLTLAIDRVPAPLFTPPPLWTLLPGTLGVLVILLPRGLPGRWLGCFMLLPLFVIKPDRVDDGQFSATVIDVGQGLAVLIETRRHRLLFDTGQPGQAERAILPVLRGKGLTRVDMLMVSHKDSDHAGGATALLAGITVGQLRSGLPPEHIARQLIRTHIPCEAGQNWQWDGVDFTVLWPDLTAPLPDENSHSCVLLVETRDTRMLIPADIGKAQEAALLARNWLGHVQIVVAGHHGSHTSSSDDFVNATQPDWVVYSAGYLNRFQHPRPIVMARYAAAGAQALRTDHDGAVLIKSGDPPQVRSWRGLHPHYWFTH